MVTKKEKRKIHEKRMREENCGISASIRLNVHGEPYQFDGSLDDVLERTHEIVDRKSDRKKADDYFSGLAGGF